MLALVSGQVLALVLRVMLVWLSWGQSQCSLLHLVVCQRGCHPEMGVNLSTLYVDMFIRSSVNAARNGLSIYMLCVTCQPL